MLAIVVVVHIVHTVYIGIPNIVGSREYRT